MQKTIRLFIIIVTTLILPAFSAAVGHAALTAPETAQIGQPFVAEIKAPKAAINFRVSWLGKESQLKAAPKQDHMLCRVILGTDLKNAKEGTAKLTFSYELNGIIANIEKNIKLQKMTYPAEKLTVAPGMVNPPKEQSERIARESKLAVAAIQTNTPGFAPTLPLVRPVPGILTSVYGKSRYFNNELRSRHGGIDMRAAAGTRVKAAGAGKVVLIGDFWFAGKCVYIDHGAGLISFYGHLSKIGTDKGAEVKAGDVIGLSGQTGRVTGPHLHFGLAWRGEYFDPAPLLSK